ncbi:MAG: TetR/AcrR family transcriptional regulator [Oscillibacter sp.]|nr:TetR/AcrR family transcriptional regulator [Oscillibacter sp.]
MNTIKTSKEIMLETSRAMAAEKGLSSVNIRALAKRCGVAVGSVYNYFPSKAALLAETVAGVWADIFYMTEGSTPTGFSNSVVWLLGCLRQGAESCPTFFAMHAQGFNTEERDTGRAVMAQYQAHMKQGLLRAMQTDPDLRPDAFSPDLTPEALVDFVFSHLLYLAAHPESSEETLLAVIRRVIYRTDKEN